MAQDYIASKISELEQSYQIITENIVETPELTKDNDKTELNYTCDWQVDEPVK